MMQAYVHLPDIKWGRNFLGAKNCRETDLSELFPTQFVPKVKSRWARVSRKGRMLFATNYVFGRCAQVYTQLIGQAQKLPNAGDARESIVFATRNALEALQTAGPLDIPVWTEEPPVLVFSDGACEHEGRLVTHGAVLLDPA